MADTAGVRLELVRPGRWRDGDAWSAIAVVLFIPVALYWGGSNLAGDSPLWLKVLIVLALPALAFAAAGATTQLRASFGPPGSIRVGGGEIVFRFDSTASEWVVPLPQVRLATVDDSSGGEKRFAVSDATPDDERAGWLWAPGKNMVPRATHLDWREAVPNIAFVFDPPIERRGAATLRNVFLYPRDVLNRRVRVIVGRVADAERARDALRERGLLGAATLADVRAALPEAGEERRYRRLTWMGRLVAAPVVALVVAWFLRAL
jgi:hypothetical protein